MRRSLPNQARGAILVMTAIIIVVMLGIAALAIDLGRLLVLRTEMQNAADAAALAAARELDRLPGAMDDARKAARDYLQHDSHFANEPALLAALDDGAIDFFNWIGSPSHDTEDPPPSCGHAADPYKCDAESDLDAAYVRVTLERDEETADSRYTIDLYFLPVLEVILGDILPTASTRAEAVAGRHDKAFVCHYPPIIICDPYPEGHLEKGQMVLLKEQGTASGAWGPGAFGWLEPKPDPDDPEDDAVAGNENKLLAQKLASTKGQPCDPPEVKVLPGGREGWPVLGLNTRFGLYTKHKDIFVAYPPAPNIVDYPRDDNLWDPDNKCRFETAERYGNKRWASTEQPGCPSSFNKEDYRSKYHPTLTPEQVASFDANASRRDVYYWELENLPNRLVERGAVSDAGFYKDEQACADSGDDKRCRILHGKLFDDIEDDFEYADLSAKRRELLVAVVDCKKNVVKANTQLDMNKVGGRWMWFFLTEHVSERPSEGVDIYAEFIKEAGPEDDDYAEHFPPLVQLYE